MTKSTKHYVLHQGAYDPRSGQIVWRECGVFSSGELAKKAAKDDLKRQHWLITEATVWAQRIIKDIIS